MASSSISFLWSKWNIRGFVMLSLLLQVILILFAPLRKKTTDKRIVFLLWLAYLMADWVAVYGIGLISHNQGYSSAHIADVDKALQVFWASFLLSHLGGPDTITAFALEDSSLWGRHLLNLTFQVGAVIYVFAQIFPSDKSLVFPTMLVFLAGVIKNVERTLALYLSSLPRLREQVLSQQESLNDKVDESCDKLIYSVVKTPWVEINLPDGNSHEEEEATLAESIVVKHAYYFFQISKLFLTDLIFTSRQRQKSQDYFHRVSAMDALRVISVELHFIYEALHTKVLATRSKWSYIFRFIAFIDIVTAFVVFNRLKKDQLLGLDVKITYLLLFGGIALDVIAVLMLVFSDWTVAEIQWYKTRPSKLDSFLHNLVSAADYVMKPPFPTCEAKLDTKVTYAVLDTPLIFRRWSESISVCNLLSENFKESPRKMYKRDCRWGNIAFSNICGFRFNMAEKTISYFHQAVDTITRGCGMRSTNGERLMIADTRYVSTNPFIMKLWIFIFKEVRRKSDYATFSEDESVIQKTREIYEARGDWFLETLPREAYHRSHDDSDTESVCEARDDEIPWQFGGHDERDMRMRILRDSIRGVNYDESVVTWHLATEMWYNREDPIAENDEREFSKIMSDYMMYLLLNQSNVVSAVAGIAQMRSAATLRRLRYLIGAEDVKSLCEAIFARNVAAADRPFRAIPLIDRVIILAREIGKLGEGKWRVMSGVWVEMLTYAAGHIKGEAHAKVLSRGGELLAFVWLLMIHLGIVYRPEWAPSYIVRGQGSLGP